MLPYFAYFAAFMVLTFYNESYFQAVKDREQQVIIDKRRSGVIAISSILAFLIIYFVCILVL